MTGISIDNIDAQIVALWNAGHTTREIGDALGKTRSAIAGRLYRIRATGSAAVPLRAGSAEPRRVMQKSRKKANLVELPLAAPKPAQAIKKASAGEIIRFPFLRLKPDPEPIVQTPEPQPAETNVGAPKDIMALGPFDCRYVVNRLSRETPALYCGAPQARGSYCSAHAELCYRREVALPSKERRLLIKAMRL
jgi:hypothetical protein